MINVMRTRRNACRLMAALLGSAAAAGGAPLVFNAAAMAQTYPARPIRIIVPLGGGSAIDVIARLTAQALASRLGQTVFVENHPGGGGAIGTREAMRALSDGYTLLFVGLNHVFAPAAEKVVDYDPVKDFAPIGTIATGSWVLVVAESVPVKSMKELVAYAKSHPGKLNWGFGLGTGPHLYGELLKAETGIEIAEISYKSGPQAITDMLGGRIDMNVGVIGTFLPLLRDGKLRALVVTGEARDPDLPDVPTMAEAGYPRLTRGFWSGLLAPAGTPAEIVNRLNREISAIAQSPAMKASLRRLGFAPKTGSPEEFAALISDEIGVWQGAAKLAGLAPK
jgi:tripartite-type tricarboxylate transporter receptor subunit TctC